MMLTVRPPSEADGSSIPQVIVARDVAYESVSLCTAWHAERWEKPHGRA